MECLALPSIEGVVDINKQVRVIYEDEERCLLWVSGLVISIDQIVDWVGGFICPKHDLKGLPLYNSMSTSPAGSPEGDMVVVLSDDNSTADDYETCINEWLTKEGLL